MVAVTHETVILDMAGERIARITLNRPEALNALSGQLTQDLADVVERLTATDEDIRCVILTGAGRAFCAGGDTRGSGSSGGMGGSAVPEAIRRNFRGAQRVMLGLHKLEIPTIAMVNGDAVGGGMDLALVCDLRVMAENARFMVAYRRIGLVPGWGGAWLYPRRMPIAKAAELMFTGDFMSAAEALQFGVANTVVPREQLEETTLALATKIAAGPPISLRIMKQLLYRGLSTDMETAMLTAASNSAIALTSEDHREGILALREKRPPAFKGR